MTTRLFLLALLLSALLPAQNKPERLERLRDQGFGLFIHWSLDSQVGSVISHSMVGASDEYVERFTQELPKTFNPTEYDPVEWARLAKLAGFQYVVFTTKHHSGFCMFDTKTTDFSIMNTPYGRDITKELVDAFREADIPIGFYFSPDDFHFLAKQGTLISRRRPEVFPENNPELMQHDLAQIRELLTNYGAIDYLFIDGPPEGLRELAWELQPDLVVTRGAIETPEQYTPGLPLEGAWEGNLTMGVQWQYRPTNDTLKSGTELLNTLIETRAKGGNLLLNIAPHPLGDIPGPQADRLREIALWMLVNRDSIYNVRPWIITNEGAIWFTRSKDRKTLYALVTGAPWKYAEEKKLLLRSVRLREGGSVRVLGQNDKVLEYRPEVVPATKWRQTDAGLEITATRAQRLYNDRRWPNPVVLAIDGAEPNLEPPVVLTSEARREGAKVSLSGKLDSLGDAASIEVAFEVRRLKDMADLYEPDDPWRTVEAGKRISPGEFMATTRLDPGRDWEYRAVARHPALTLYGAVQPIGKLIQ